MVTSSGNPRRGPGQLLGGFPLGFTLFHTSRPGLGFFFEDGWVVVALPFAYAVFGWLQGALAGVLFNLACRFTGGIRVEVSSVEENRQEDASHDWAQTEKGDRA